MAPEVIKQEIAADEGRDLVEENVDNWKRADVWSIGCTLVEMCTGKSPWGNMTSLPAAMLHIASTGTAPPLDKDASDNAKAFVQGCCHSVASERHCARELLHHPFLIKHSQRNNDIHDRSSQFKDPSPRCLVSQPSLAQKSLQTSVKVNDTEVGIFDDNSDSDNEWGDIATPRKLLKSRSGSSPLVYVPPLDLKRALSTESGKDKSAKAPKAANRTLAQSAFLKKLGGKSKNSPWVKRDASKNGKLLEGW